MNKGGVMCLNLDDCIESNEKVELDFPNEIQHIVDYILYVFIEKATISELEAI